jgi:hypothetical protein
MQHIYNPTPAEQGRRWWADMQHIYNPPPAEQYDCSILSCVTPGGTTLWWTGGGWRIVETAKLQINSDVIESGWTDAGVAKRWNLADMNE